jgi:hypothetical protein
MKGSDSAMPVWADFMKDALALHPEWNGDWAMPANVRKAEIDIRNGTLIRELDAVENASADPSPVPSPEVDLTETDPAWETEQIPEPKEIFVSDVPAEFKRVELFIGGTIPNRSVIQPDDPLPDGHFPDDVPSGGSPTPTPLDGTWQQKLETNTVRPMDGSDSGDRSSVSLRICPVTGMRATSRCPGSEVRKFHSGEEPSEFCTFHR